MTASALPTAVLLHGAFLDGSCWDGVIRHLQERGHAVIATQLPLHSLAAAAAATRRTLARIAGPVVLVGHSWGGVVITEVGVDARVVGLVYVAAGAPNVSESFNDLLKMSTVAMPGVAGIQPDAEGFLWYDPAQFQAGLAADVAASRVRHLATVQQPVAAQAFADPVTQAAWQTKPAWYAIAAGDAILDPALQQQLARRINAKSVTLAGASHCAMVAQPQPVAEWVMRALESTAAR
jgi:pimeloyl-ACP methyl ester carboxylesterase